MGKVKLNSISIESFRSIEKVTISFPDKSPVILFGPNNFGKSNILRGIECLLGEKYPSYIDFIDSDYFQRDKTKYPQIKLSVNFSGNISNVDTIFFTTNFEYKDQRGQRLIENTYHNANGSKLYVKNEERQKCQFVLIDATRDIGRQLSYYSQYSMLSKMSKKMHEAITLSSKNKLDKCFDSIKETFEEVTEYKNFYDKLQSNFSNNIDGFEHKLSIDLSAYDPNNYFHSLRIVANDGSTIRAFEEFGTGEQQILLMSFVKAYAETFSNETCILGIEEPEAHLHPIAQKWLSNNIKDFAKNGIQVIITTHSPEFLDIDNFEGLVKVYKEDNTTKVIQSSVPTLVKSLVDLGVDSKKINESNVLGYYKTRTFYDQLKGLFARRIILVEGETEMFSFPNYFTKMGYSLPKSGTEIINCHGKDQLCRNYRFFKLYNYKCFCIFDADNGNKNSDLSKTFNFNEKSMVLDSNKFTLNTEFGYFGHDFESYMRSNFDDYEETETKVHGEKVVKAKILSEIKNYNPEFINDIANMLNIERNKI